MIFDIPYVFVKNNAFASVIASSLMVYFLVFYIPQLMPLWMQLSTITIKNK